MTTRGQTSDGLPEIERLLATGQVAAARERLRAITSRERAQLSEELGEESLLRAERSAAVVSRGSPRGRVVVVPGIMGSLLDVRGGGAGARIWLSVLRLARGRFSDLELGADGATGLEGRDVEVAGLHRSYLPLIMHLDQEWEVLPFAYDWRVSIDAAADLLAGRIEGWARGEKAHVVAHSMGGLVARSLSLRYPELWASMGGRLVMLGTPNRGSYSIPLTLLGQERMVKLLSLVDVFHSRREIGRILATFPGPYELLPSPGADVDDDREQLYAAETWGDAHVSRRHLARAREFHTQMTEVIDPGRLAYVAGYGRRTPHLVRVGEPGELELSSTRAGDGRVSHALGLLEGVETYYVDEGHGSLPRAPALLDALASLLAGEAPAGLATEAPAETRGAEEREWIPAAEFDAEPEPEELEAELRSIRLATRGADDRPAPDDPVVEARIAREMVRDYLGEPSAGAPRAGAGDGREPAGPPTALRVAWGDITEMDECDVVAVGHYQGVLPQFAELALDRAMSEGADHLIITEQSRRGLIRGDPGTVTFLPWPSAARPGRVVAVCGMGRPGTFDATRLRRLVQNLIWACASLPGEGRVCSVLIGSGEGTQTIEQAAAAWVEGASDAARGGLSRPLASITIVERDRRRAQRALAAFGARAGGGDGLALEAEELQRGPGGAVGAEDAFALAVAVVARALREGAAKADRAAAVRLLRGLPLDARRGGEVRAALTALAGDDAGVDEIAQSLDISRVAPASSRGDAGAPDTAERMSFIASDEGIRAAAITNTTTVPERLLQPGTLIQELAERMAKELGDPGARPTAQRVGELGEFLCALVVPHEFERIIESPTLPLVVEVDRTTGQLHWETLPGGERPVAVARPTARQLRTTRSPAPAPPRARRSTLKVLILGDPGPPSQGLSLEGARREALEVHERLASQEGIETVALIGSPSGPEPGFPPADRLTALMQLLNGDYDIVHYTGHGDYDPGAPDRAGWLFEGGKITARELLNAEHLPSLIVANACLTGRIAGGGGDGRPAATPLSEAGLLPSLADAFFQYGVRDYIGTAWEVSDAGAVLFAQTLYERLLEGESIGASVRAARERLWDRRDRFGSLWVAYQHYGDPTSGNVLRPAGISSPRPANAGRAT